MGQKLLTAYVPEKKNQILQKDEVSNHVLFDTFLFFILTYSTMHIVMLFQIMSHMMTIHMVVQVMTNTMIRTAMGVLKILAIHRVAVVHE